MKTFGIALNNLKKSLAPIEKHLKLRNFLVGHSLTLADVALVANLVTPLQTVLDQQYRKEAIPSLTRYCQIILEGRSFVQTFGRIHFAKKILMPQVPKPAAPEQKPAKEAPKPAPAKKEAPAKSAPEAPPQAKEVTWEDKLPEIKNGFALFDFKTLIVNAADKKEALKTLWSGWDEQAFSFYFVHYQKYDGEGQVMHLTNNLLNGFLQRMDDKMRKHSLCVLGVYGDEPALEIMGVFFWRGLGIIEPMLEHPQFEYFNKRKLDI
jgi:elongation factor 1-gamma